MSIGLNRARQFSLRFNAGGTQPKSFGTSVWQFTLLIIADTAFESVAHELTTGKIKAFKLFAEPADR